MSWRATPSRPAPPITSTSVDQLFSSSPSSSSSASGTPRSARSFRSISSPHGPGSAASHLARQIVAMDDDSKSIRSVRSNLTVSARDNGGGRNGGRSRAGSYANSVASGRTARGGGSSSNGNSIKGGKGIETESISGGNGGEEEMELEDSSRPGGMDIKGKGKDVDPNGLAYKTPPQRGDIPLDRPESTEGGGTIPQVVKRQKTDGGPSLPSPVKSPGKALAASPTTTAGPSSSRIASGSGWLVSRGWRAAPVAPTALVTEDTTPKLLLTDESPKKATDFRPNPSAPSPTTAIKKEPSLVSFVPDPPRVSTSTPTPTPTSTSHATPKASGKIAELVPPPNQTLTTGSRRTSWFGGPSISTSSSTASLSRLANGSADSDPAPIQNPTAAPLAPTPSIPTIETPSEQADIQTTSKTSNVAVMEEGKASHLRGGSGGWLSMLSMSRSVSQPNDLGKEGKRDDGEPIQSTQHSSDVALEVGRKVDAGELLAKDGAMKAPPALNPDDSSLRPPQHEIPSIMNQRASWWGWGGAAPSQPAQASEAKAPQVSEPTPVQATPEPDAPTAALGPTEPTPSDPAPPAPAPAKTWRQTFWGGGEEAPAKKLEDKTADLSIDNVPPQSPSSPMIRTSLSSERLSSLEAVPPMHPLPAPVQSLRNKSSWFFSSSPKDSSLTSPNLSQGGGGSPTASGSSTPAYPISMQGEDRGRTTVSQMSKSPLTGLGMSHSIASSRASSHTNNSAPNSPILGPQSDGPVKPLTGSLRNSPRPGSYEPEPPPENLVLPTFGDTFNRPPRSFPPKKGTLTKAVSVVSAYLFNQPPSPKMDLSESRKFDPAERLPKDLTTMGEASRLHKIKRVVTIGVHGWFPNPMLKSVLGEPTGTSVKFATQMHDAVQTYLESHDISAFNIQAIALEGAGKIEDRVNRLWDQLVGREEWVQALKKADAVFLATHSQGSIVSTHLLARMLKEGLVQGSKTHMLAMCGIVQGPFVYLSQSYTLTPYFNILESAAARELFEFQDPESPLTLSFLRSLKSILDHGLKITCIGSINDQVVPLYSALFAGVSHPSLIRAVYIDSAAFRTSDFLANLVVFACRLRNANLSDHDLLVNVSEALAGALTGVGHSIVYESLETFTLAVRYQFETTGLGEAPTHHPVVVAGGATSNATGSDSLSMVFNPRAPRNPYLLTWALRGIIEDPLVRDLFGNELMALREAFETWRPATKVLKDVKLKLEGIRMLPRVKKEGKL